MLQPYDTVRIRNTGPEPWTDRWNGRIFKCDPGSEAFVPFAGVCLWFGHPNAFDVPNDPKQRYRTDEFARLCTRYGIYENHQEFVPGLETVRDERNRVTRKAIPSIQVYTLEGEQLTTVVEDPEGRTVNPAVMQAQEKLDLHAQIAQLQAQMSVLLQQAGAQERADTAVSASPNVSGDGPPVTQAPPPMPQVPPFAPPPDPGTPDHPLIPGTGGTGGPPVPAGFNAPTQSLGGPEVGPRSETVIPPGDPLEGPDEVREDSPTRVRVSN